MAIPSEFVPAQVGKGCIELHIAREQLPAGSHRGIHNVVTDAGYRAPADQISLTVLRPIATDIAIVGMRRGKAHFGPGLERRSTNVAASLHKLLVCAVVVKEVELDQFDALVFEIQQRPGHAALDRCVFQEQARWE